MSVKALLNTLGTRCRTLPLVILYVTEGCNLRCISCSYRNPLPGELTLGELGEIAPALKASGLRHIVYSGGEPLLRRDFPRICTLFDAPHIRQSLLTNGLLLEKRFPEIRRFLGEVIVSLDGPDEETHDGIRGAGSFRQIVRGIRSAVELPDAPTVSLRTVIQKRNFRTIPGMVRFAHDLGVSRISFLAADVGPEAFGRSSRGAVVPREELALDAGELAEFRQVISRMTGESAGDFSSGFIAESPARLMRLAEYFEALIGLGQFPPTSCNAPMVSVVITSTGELLPCYFLPRFGNIRQSPLPDLLNGHQIRSTRSEVRAGTPGPCKTCVCTLNVSPGRALLGRF
jgi:MoaA/NifB/PqqE/SkfB family radical SAM enzyme